MTATPARFLAAKEIDEQRLESAIRYAVNYHGLDAKLNLTDHYIARLLMPEVSKHLRGKTDAMTLAERARIGQEEKHNG